MKSALVTGGAGFIGSHLIDRLLKEGWQVTVVDNFDPFYDPTLKRKNIAPHLDYDNYTLVEADIRDMETMKEQLKGDYDVIVHLAAKAGVRPSIKDPVSYQENNVRGTQNLLELAKLWGTKQFIFASSSSVYGINPNVPWREDDCVLLPISPYAATKVAGELLGHVYSHLYGIRFIALRFFTVYGPRQRPDLAIHKFARLMLKGEPIPVYGDGSSRRDYTYIDDVINGVRAAMDYTNTKYEVINLGNNRTISLMELIRTLEEVLGVKAKLEYLPPQPGDVPQTWADMEKARRILSYNLNTKLIIGLKEFTKWLRNII
ncbi:MAG: NAD-dependent epimerase/dehydratase family protein [Clostridia bacterium]|nr:NAD-dependent epimerase/dehydratase family protein [Clostridia bacterium]